MNILPKSILIFLIVSSNLQGQSIIDLAEITLKISAFGYEEFYYGFAEGDQLIFNFIELNNKELKEVEIIELPSSSKFMYYKCKKIENKTISISRTGIYKFRFLNGAITKRVCNVKIQRISASEITKNFNSSVYWKTVQDTTYTPTEEKFLIKSDTIIQNVYSSSPQISSKNALNGNKPYQIIDFVLPENTISWGFYIGCGNKGKQEYENAKENFVKSAAAVVSKIPGYGPLAALAITGISYFNKVQGDDNVKYWFLSDKYSVENFEAGLNFYQYKKGDVINEASKMQYPLLGKVYLALLNDNIIDPIKLTIEVVAIQVIQEWETRVVQLMKVKNREEPYLKN